MRMYYVHVCKSLEFSHYPNQSWHPLSFFLSLFSLSLSILSLYLSISLCVVQMSYSYIHLSARTCHFPHPRTACFFGSGVRPISEGGVERVRGPEGPMHRVRGGRPARAKRLLVRRAYDEMTKLLFISLFIWLRMSSYQTFSDRGGSNQSVSQSLKRTSFDRASHTDPSWNQLSSESATHISPHCTRPVHSATALTDAMNGTLLHLMWDQDNACFFIQALRGFHMPGVYGRLF